MPIYSTELLIGSQPWLQQQDFENNEKFKNLFFLPENEQQIYLAAGSSESSKTVSDRGSTVRSEKRSSEDCDSALNKSDVMDPLFKINTMKFMTSPDLKIANQVKFAILDIRTVKKPRLTEIFKDQKNSKKENYIPILELDYNKRKNLKIQDFAAISDYHIVVVQQDFAEIPYQGRSEEALMYTTVIELLKKQSFVGLLQGGAKELFRTLE